MKAKPKHVFDLQAFLNSAGVTRRGVECQRKERIFSKADASNTILDVQ